LTGVYSWRFPLGDESALRLLRLFPLLLSRLGQSRATMPEGMATLRNPQTCTQNSGTQQGSDTSPANVLLEAKAAGLHTNVCSIISPGSGKQRKRTRSTTMWQANARAIRKPLSTSLARYRAAAGCAARRSMNQANQRLKFNGQPRSIRMPHAPKRPTVPRSVRGAHPIPSPRGEGQGEGKRSLNTSHSSLMSLGQSCRTHGTHL